jgi:transposase
LCPGLSAPGGHGELGRSLPIESSTIQAVLAVASRSPDGAPTVKSLVSRAPGKLTRAAAGYWVTRWRGCLAPPADAEQRAAWLGRDLGRDLARYRTLLVDIAAQDQEVGQLVACTEGQVLTSLPGVAAIRAAAFAVHSLPIGRFPDAEHLYSATGLAPAMYESATLRKRARISRQGLAEHRDALMGIAWGLATCSPAFAQRDAEYRARGMAPIRARVAIARRACRLTFRLLKTQQPFDEERYRRGRLSPGR